MVDSRRAVNALLETDPGFVALCKTLTGDALDPDEVFDYLYGREPIVKMSPDPSDLGSSSGGGVRRLKGKKGLLVSAGAASAAGVGGAVAARGRGRRGRVEEREVGKSLSSYTWVGTISKAIAPKKQVFGWAAVSEIDGRPVVDYEMDHLLIEELEKSAYDYVQNSRVGGYEHLRDGDDPFHAAEMIESMVFTDEKVKALGLPDDFPRAWWTGFQVKNDKVWQDVVDGKVTQFSVHGKGRRVQVPLEALV